MKEVMSIRSKKERLLREPRQSFFAQVGEAMRRDPPTLSNPRGGSIWYAILGFALLVLWMMAHYR